MNRATPQMRNFAERLIAYESNGNPSRGSKTPAACLVTEKLRPHLATLLGSTGFRALLSRALLLANAEAAWLSAVQVNGDGVLEGLDALDEQVAPDEMVEGCVVLLAQLLGLLVAFIGEKLTLRLVQEIWPKISVNDLNSNKVNKNEKAN